MSQPDNIDKEVFDIRVNSEKCKNQLQHYSSGNGNIPANVRFRSVPIEVLNEAISALEKMAVLATYFERQAFSCVAHNASDIKCDYLACANYKALQPGETCSFQGCHVKRPKRL